MADLHNKTEHSSTGNSHAASAQDGGGRDTNTRPYKMLALAMGIHFVIMFALTFAGVNAVDEIFINLNRFYMAMLMVGSMVIVMVAVMWTMFKNKVLNVAILGVAALVFVSTFAALRSETFVGNKQFLRSMIPHHSIAIHTCNNARIDDPEIIGLCDQIVQAQREEIAQMRQILERLED